MLSPSDSRATEKYVCKPFPSFRIECDLWLNDQYSKCRVMHQVMNPHDLLNSFNVIMTEVCS